MNKILRLLEILFRRFPETLDGKFENVNTLALAVVSGIPEWMVKVVLKHTEAMVLEIKEKREQK